MTSGTSAPPTASGASASSSALSPPSASYASAGANYTEDAAWQADFQSIEEISVDPSTSDLLVKVPSDQVGRMIGKSGQVVRDLQGKSGAFINMGKDGDTHRIAQISGNYPETYLCAVLLVAKLTPRENTAKHEMLDRLAQFFHKNRAMPHVVESFAVPEEHLGRVIGKSGHTLRELQELSRARIEFPKTAPVAPEHHRVLLISGAPEEVAHCRELLTARISRDESSGSGSGSGTATGAQDHRGEASPAASTSSLTSGHGRDSHHHHHQQQQQQLQQQRDHSRAEFAGAGGMRPPIFPTYYNPAYGVPPMPYYGPPHMAYEQGGVMPYYMPPFAYMQPYASPYPAPYGVADMTTDMSRVSLSPSVASDSQDAAADMHSQQYQQQQMMMAQYPYHARMHAHALPYPLPSPGGSSSSIASVPGTGASTTSTTSSPSSAASGLSGPAYVGRRGPGFAGGPGALGSGQLHAAAPTFMPGYSMHRHHEAIVPIPAELVGRLIGRQGGAVKQLQMETRTRVDVLDPDPSAVDPTRYVRITALLPENVRLCEAHIRNRVAAHYGSMY